uniref:PGG domain-containing protein n=1 Tax=Oryza punctata TaxID=4537 RepID=A0A0E0JJ26_ORYPU
MHPKLLMACRVGDAQRLKDLVSEESAGRVPLPPPDLVVVRLADEGPAPSSLLEGVTSVEGDSALHVVASRGGGDGGSDGELLSFLESAKVIHERARHLLHARNKKGDTPLHYAARAGVIGMVSLLIDLAATGERWQLLRGMNASGETALHEAVRAGSKDVVVRLMAEDCELAGFPRDGGISPLYLAVLLDEIDIARSLYAMSHGNLSYSGPGGQNALHAAVLRGKGTYLPTCSIESAGRVPLPPPDLVVVRLADEGPAPSSLLEGVTSVEGDSALHVVASRGGGDGGSDGELLSFLESAKVIHERARHLLHARNKKGDTPLHYAARAGVIGMVSLLIDLAATGERWQLLRGMNASGETALHEAVRAGSKDVVVRLMAEDCELAGFPRDGGISPLYLAVLLDEIDIARSLYAMSHGNLSYSGPGGQNALHAAVLRGKVMTEMLLDWNMNLTEQGDRDGCTPLHFSISQVAGQNHGMFSYANKLPWMCFPTLTTDTPFLLLQTNPSSAYQPDDSGSFPIHIAAAVGANKTVSMFLQTFPDSSSLRDAKGRSFLHVAVEKKRCSIVKHACRIPSLKHVLNMQDNDGNTALHLAVKVGDTKTFFLLFRNQHVRTNLTNKNGQTPRDTSICDIPPGLSYKWNPKQTIHRALARARTNRGVYRGDQFEEEHILRPKREDEEKESEKLNNSTQTLGISSVLIATVTFGAAFALPGGYIADDHAHGGAPTLAGRYSFEAFIVANMLAFICSSIGTIGLMYSGITTVDLPTRQKHFLRSLFFVSSSLTSLVAAFALGTYVVLAPIAHKTAVGICVISPVVVIYRSVGRFQRMYALAGPLYTRAGIVPLLMLAKDIFTRMLRLYWPFLVIFTWATCARNYGHRHQ